ncbi:hypothetical protein GF322_00920 [Candidatus Dependentiae bacterium]|nr:hypothetical protein [Candidatus Dependentiae bacterium]
MNKFLLICLIIFFNNSYCINKYLNTRKGMIDTMKLFNTDESQHTLDLIKTEEDVLNIIDLMYLDVRQVLLDRDIVGLEDDEVIYFFQDLSPLVNNISSFNNFETVSSNDKLILRSAFCDTVCNFVSKIDLDKVSNFIPDKDFELLKKMQVIDDYISKRDYVENLIKLEDKKVSESFIRDFFLALTYHLNEKIDNYISEIKQKLIIYDQTKSNPARKRRKKQIAATIFQTLSYACSQLGKITGKKKKQGVLELFGTVFNMASQTIDPPIEEIEGEILKVHWIGQKILTNKLFQSIISSILLCLQEYLHEKLKELLAYLCERSLKLILYDESCKHENSCNSNKFLYENERIDKDAK